MITGDLKSKIDRIWDAFWSGGIFNPLEVIEQITYLLFIKRHDDLQINAEERATLAKKPIGRAVFPAGKDAQGRLYDGLRWSVRPLDVAAAADPAGGGARLRPAPNACAVSANQIDFVNLIVGHLTENGVMDVGAPFRLAAHRRRPARTDVSVSAPIRSAGWSESWSTSGPPRCPTSPTPRRTR